MTPFTKEKFQSALNETFTLHAAGGQSLSLTLISIKDGRHPLRNSETADRAPFSIFFRGPRTPWAQQHIYRLENATLGEMELFLVPLGPEKEGMVYQATFG